MPHRGLGSCFVEKTPKGTFSNVNGESCDTIGVKPILPVHLATGSVQRQRDPFDLSTSLVNGILPGCVTLSLSEAEPRKRPDQSASDDQSNERLSFLNIARVPEFDIKHQIRPMKQP